MGFTSLGFLAFFLITWMVYLLLPGKARAAWLLAASYLFCASFSLSFLWVLLFSTFVTWLCGLGLEAGVKGLCPKVFFAGAILFQAALLAFFKYNRQGILLPLGISFYTFQSIGYLTDIWRGDERAERNLLRFALFQAFFPKLVQGPIERSQNLLRQIRELPEKQVRDLEKIRQSALLLLWGLCEKLLIADRIAIPVNAVYSQFGAFGGVEIVLATVLYAFQLYCDFAGYTDMARGLAGMLGFDLAVNFRRPYFADSIQDFWRRWHLSLSSWLKDYLYIPLGGSRKGELRRNGNLLATFVVSGIWHGTGVHFLLWGLLHGIGQVAERAVNFRNRKLPRAVKQILVFVFVDLTWMVFRVNSLGDLKGMLFVTVTDFRLKDFAGMQLSGFEWVLILLGILLIFAKDLANERGFAFRPCLLNRGPVLRCLIYTALVGVLVIFGVYGAAYDTSGFLYTQF